MRLLVAIGLLFPAACGGGGDESGPRTGRFLDGPVAGLAWETPTESGRTDAAGAFLYRPGERVDFWIGDVWLGQAPAAPVLTPLDLVPGAADANHPTVNNLARFLQTLDGDGIPENGIRISATVHVAAQGRDIDFSLDGNTFGASPDVAVLLAAAEENGAFSAGPGPRALVSAESAAAHLAKTLAALAPSAPNPGSGDGPGGSDGAGGSDGSSGGDPGG